MNNKKLQCSFVPSRGFDSYEYIVNGVSLDEFRCFMYKTAAFFISIKFDYICFSMLLLIIYISIFGGIKGNYRWFILNQAIWDLFITNDYFCKNEYHYTSIFDKTASSPTRCFYTDYVYDIPGAYINGLNSIKHQQSWLLKMILSIISSNSYTALLLLSFTRFICLYFMHFYEKLTKKHRIFYLIFTFNILMIITNFYEMFKYFGDQRDEFVEEICFEALRKKNNLTAKNKVICESSFDFWLNILFIIQRIFLFLQYSKSPICLLLSIIAAGFIIFRISKQFRFQLKNNRKDFINSFRICAVVVIQNILTSIVFFLETIRNFESTIASVFGIVVITIRGLDTFENRDNIEFILPKWLDGYHGLATPFILNWIRQCRIFIETFVVLVLMAGYREAIFGGFKWIGNALENRIGISSWISKFSHSRSTRVIIISASTHTNN